MISVKIFIYITFLQFEMNSFFQQHLVLCILLLYLDCKNNEQRFKVQNYLDHRFFSIHMIFFKYTFNPIFSIREILVYYYLFFIVFHLKLYW